MQSSNVIVKYHIRIKKLKTDFFGSLVKEDVFAHIGR